MVNMPQRECTKSKVKVTRPQKRITLPIEMEKYQDIEGKKQVFTIVSIGVMPYLVGYTDEVEKALFLRRFVSVALGADTANLTAAYQHFKDEAQTLKPDYTPETVNLHESNQ